MSKVPDAAAYLSPYVTLPAVREGMNLPKQVLITDCTTREGEQAADVSFGVEEKLGIIRRLDVMGIHQVQCGYPFKSRVDRETMQALKSENLKCKTEVIAQVFVEEWHEEIDAAIAVQPDILDIQFPSSDARLSLLVKMSREEAVRRSSDAVRYAAGRVPVIRYAPTDTTRTNLDFLKQLFEAVLKAGAHRITVADTAGTAIPSAIRYLVGQVVQAFQVPVEVHCHNDYGLALANTLAAVEAGAQVADATINGLGERAGNVSLDELILALQNLYGLRLNVDTSRLFELSAYVAGISGIPVPPGKPLVGANAFAHKLEGHVHGVLTHPPLYEPLPPETVGNRRRISIGKYSGRHVIRYKLRELGLQATDLELDRIILEVERQAVAKRNSLSDAEFDAILSGVLGR